MDSSQKMAVRILEQNSLWTVLIMRNDTSVQMREFKNHDDLVRILAILKYPALPLKTALKAEPEYVPEIAKENLVELGFDSIP